MSESTAIVRGLASEAVGPIASAGNAQDLALAQRVVAGQRVAMGELYAAHRACVLRHLRAYLGPGYGSLEDLVQDTFLRATSHLRNYEGRASLSAWLRGVAINLARNHRSKHCRRSTLHSQAAQDAGELGQSRGADHQIDSIVALYQLLDQVEEHDREVFVLRSLEDLTVKEVAALLGLPTSTVSYRHRRAIETMKRLNGEEHA